MIETIAVFKNIFRTQRNRYTMAFQKIVKPGNSD
jgi:hypothetical protein